MGAIKIAAMGGMRPIIDDRMLPDNLAAYCANTIVRTGAIRPFSEPVQEHRFEGENYPAARRLRFNSGSTYWYPLTNINSNIVKAPLVNDAFERFYILDPPGTPMRFNTRSRIIGGDPSYLLGMPAPTAAPTVVVNGGVAVLQETRAYVYTFVDEFGQEGPPSEAGLATGPIDADDWTLSDLDTDIPDSDERPTIYKKIYRTQVAAGGQVNYYFVGQIDITDATFVDTQTNEENALSYTLPSISYLAPPDDLDGFIVMPGGFLVGWEGRNLHMSETYRPWAWPAEYDLALEFQIVGCGVTDQTLVAATTGNPYAVTGNTPAAMTPSRLDRFEPCLSRGSIVSGLGAVFYSSPNGLIAASASGIVDLTQSIIGRDFWVRDYGTNIFGSARLGPYYIAFNNSSNGLGFMFRPNDDRESVIRLLDFAGVSAVWSDAVSDDVMGMFRDGDDSVVMRLTPRDGSLTGTARVFSWKSKEFFLAQPTNFGVIQVMAEGDPLGTSAQNVVAGVSKPYPVPTVAVIPPLTAAQIHERLGATSVVGYMGIGRWSGYFNEGPMIGDLPPGAEGSGWEGWPGWPGINKGAGRNPAFDLSLPEGAMGMVYVYSNRVQIYKELLQPNKQLRLPSGFRSTMWQVLVVSRVPIFSIHLATHGKELAVV